MKRHNHWMLAICLAVAGCQAQAPSLPATAVAAAPLPAPVEIADNGELLRLAAQALRAQRLYAPAGDNAVEFYLAARERTPDDGAIGNALVELQPYLLIATEQALERGDAGESGRLFELLRRLDPQAPALARLQQALQAAPMQASADVPPPRPATTAPAMAPAPTPPRTPAPASPIETTVAVPAASAQSPATAVTPPPPPSLPAAPTAAVVNASPRRAAVSGVPRLLQDAQPRYPLPALRNRLEGQVEVAFVIRPDGSVGDVRLVAAQPRDLFDAAAIAAASRWRFEASGQSHPSQRTIHFRLPP